MKNFKLWVHNSSFSEDNLVIDPKEFPEIGIGDVLEIYHPDEQNRLEWSGEDQLALLDKERLEAHALEGNLNFRFEVKRLRVMSHLLLQVKSFSTPLQQKDIISVEQGIANLFKLRAYNPVCVEPVDPNTVAIDLVELLFKEQYISRSDMWRLKEHLMNSCMYFHQMVEYLGIRAQVSELWSKGQQVTCGYVNGDTRITFRSSTAIVSMFIQMSSEMWEFDTCGDLYMEKAVNGFLTELFHKWNDRNICHEVSITLFSRTFYEVDSIDDIPESAKCRIHVDIKGRFYEDFYRVMVQNMRQDDWVPFLVTLKRNMLKYERDLQDTISKVPGMPRGNTCKSSEGNIMEAINMALNVFDNHYINRNFDRTGQLVVIVSPGAGVIEVEKDLCEITKDRMIDYGIGSDLVCLAEQPPHPVPLVIYTDHNPALESKFDKYNILHWLNHSFYISQSQRRILASSKFCFMPRMRIPERVIRPGEDAIPSLPKLKTPHPLTEYYQNGGSEDVDEDEIYRQHDRRIFQQPELDSKPSENNPFYPSKLKVKLCADRRRWTHTFPHGPKGEVIQMHHNHRILDNCRGCSADNAAPEDRLSTSTSGSSLHSLVQDNTYDPDLSGMASVQLTGKKRFVSTFGVTGEQKWCPCVISDVDWKSLTTTGCFPLTTDFYPDKNTLDKDYKEDPYTMDVQDGFQASGRNPADDIFEELIAQRLIQDFQVVIIPCTEMKQLEQKGSSHFPLVTNQDKKSYVLSYGTTFHHISLNSEKTTIKVIHHVANERKKLFRRSYTYSLWPVGKSTYELSRTRIYHKPLDLNVWNYRDNYIRCGGAPADEDDEENFQLNENLKFWRSRFLLLPAFTQLIKKMSDSGYTGPYDVFEPPTETQKQQLLDGFLRFAESLNKKRRPVKTHKLSSDNTNSPNALSTWKSSRSSGTATPTAVNHPVSSGLAESNILSQVVSSLKNFRDDSTPQTSSVQSVSAPLTLDLTTPLEYMVAAMKEQSTGISFIAGEQRGLPPFTFISSEGVSWAQKRLEGNISFDDALDLMQVCLKKNRIQAVFGGEANNVFIYGYYLYYIPPEGDYTDTNKVKNRSSVHYDSAAESPVWFEVECVSPDRKKKIGRSPCYKSMDFELDCTRNPSLSEQFQRCQLGFHECFSPDQAFEIELQWLTSSPNSLLEVLTTWSRRAFPLGLHFIPSIIDPFASLEEISDPMSRPMFVPLKIPYHEMDTETFQTIQKQILQRFGFILDHTSKYSPVKLALSHHKNIEDFFHEQYVHSTGHAFVLPNNDSTKPNQGFRSAKDACICRRPSPHNICIQSNSEAVCYIPEEVQRELETGFLWTRNYLMSKRWKTQSTGDEKFHEQLLKDFMNFCSNSDGRLENLISQMEGISLNIEDVDLGKDDGV